MKYPSETNVDEGRWWWDRADILALSPLVRERDAPSCSSGMWVIAGSLCAPCDITALFARCAAAIHARTATR
eukprot:scaffold83604_cov34-Tisochrysis_lutea.AAC.2